MKTSKFPVEQISFARRQAETGTMVAEVCRRMRITDAASCHQTMGAGGLGFGKVLCFKNSRRKIGKIKKLVANLSFDKHMLQDVLAKKL